DTRSSADADAIITSALDSSIYLRRLSPTKVGISLDETVGVQGLKDILSVFAKSSLKPGSDLESLEIGKEIALPEIPSSLLRTSPYLTHAVFNTHHSETEMLRYIHHLESKDLSLAHSMIPLGSCTMKLNATTEML